MTSQRFRPPFLPGDRVQKEPDGGPNQKRQYSGMCVTAVILSHTQTHHEILNRCPWYPVQSWINQWMSRDVRIMRKIFGPCVACVKGKTVRATPGRVINQWVASAPGERLCIDIFFLYICCLAQVTSSQSTFPDCGMVDEYTEYVIITYLAHLAYYSKCAACPN
jgi:hypothetical protein